MFDDQAPDDHQDEGNAEYRVAWRIGNSSGHGEWFFSRAYVQSWVDYENKRYGPGTHWVEESATRR